MKNDFSKRFQLLASNKNFTQADIVRLLGKNRAAVSKWWNGDIVPVAKNMIEIARLFNSLGLRLYEFDSRSGYQMKSAT